MATTERFTVKGGKVIQLFPGTETEAQEKLPPGLNLANWVDEMVGRAMSQADFSNLPGKGKPLNLRDSDPYGGDEARLYEMLKNAGLTPEWIELRQKIVGEMNWIRANAKSPERPSRIVETNILIDKHNRLVPKPLLALPKLPRDFGHE